jgi:rhamnosyl/mannosyltransferase
MQHESATTTTEQDGSVAVTRFHPSFSLYKLEFSRELNRALRKPDADILHLHVPNPTMLLALRFAKPRTPIVVTYHSDVVRQQFLGMLFRPIERYTFKRVKLVFMASPNYAAGSRFLKAYQDKLRVLTFGLNLAPYLTPSIQALELASKIKAQFPAPVWLACGRLVYYKGLKNAIQALAKVTGTLIIVGEGPERAALEAEAKRTGVSERVHFAGRLPEIHDLLPYYLAAEALWFPSNARSEAFGLVQVEAMACGCPVLNTNIPFSGVAWVSRHEESGLTVPVDDPCALAAAAQRLLNEPGLRAKLSQGAVDRTKRDFSDEPMARASLQLYREALGK